MIKGNNYLLKFCKWKFQWEMIKILKTFTLKFKNSQKKLNLTIIFKL